MEIINVPIIGDDDLQELDLRLHCEKWLKQNYVPIPKRGSPLYERLYTQWEDGLIDRIVKNCA